MNARGFTLLEMLMVVAIIGILAGVIIGSINDSRDKARSAAASRELSTIRPAIELLFADTGLYPHKQPSYCPPRNASGNEVNLNLPSSGLRATDGTYSEWDGPYIGDMTDPWGNPYFLDEDYYCTPGVQGCDGHDSSTGDRSVLVSCGPDGMIGDDPAFPSKPSNGTGCAYNDDNIVLNLCPNN